MKNWDTLEPDVVRLLNKHFTAGRGGRKIDMIVVHHNAGVLSIDQIWQVWQDRQASAHYQIETSGRIGQLVWDRDTAWHAANASVNARSIGLEFSNSAGAAAGWPIADATIEEGAHLIAAICRFYQLGRPAAGKNVRFHNEFTSTSCPGGLGPGGRYHNTLMTRAGYWFDRMTSGASGSGSSVPGAGAGADKGGITMSEVAQVTEFVKGFVGPIGSDVKDIRQQLTGGRDRGEYPGFSQIDDRTVVDALAVIGEKLGIPGFVDPHGGSLKAKRAGVSG